MLLDPFMAIGCLSGMGCNVLDDLHVPHLITFRVLDERHIDLEVRILLLEECSRIIRPQTFDTAVLGLADVRTPVATGFSHHVRTLNPKHRFDGPVDEQPIHFIVSNRNWPWK